MKMTCTNCKKRKLINPFASLPSMLGFQLDDGRMIYLCTECICKVGEMDDEGKRKFFERLGVTNE